MPVTDFTHHFATNQSNWDGRAPLHASRTSGYGTQAFVDDKKLVSNVVKFDLPRLRGIIKGRRTVHLQCHIGTDTLSLARLGGTEVVGLDFSPESVKAARELVAETGDQVRFVEANVIDALTVLSAGAYDLVFTGIGALCWLPDIDQWAGIVAALLAPGGRLFVREGHPTMWAVDEEITDAPGPVLRLPYWNVREPMEWVNETTYVPVDGPLPQPKMYVWNHALSEVVTALLKHGLVLELFEEHDSVPWECFPKVMVKRDLDEWALKERSGCCPLSYTIVARKP